MAVVQLQTLPKTLGEKKVFQIDYFNRAKVSSVENAYVAVTGKTGSWNRHRKKGKSNDSKSRSNELRYIQKWNDLILTLCMQFLSSQGRFIIYHVVWCKNIENC